MDPKQSKTTAAAGRHDAPPAGRSYREARTVEELTQRNVQAIQRLDAAAVRRAGRMDGIAARISAFAGTPRFLVIHVVGFAAWILFNTFPATPHFDPYPFTFLTLVVSLEAIFLATFVLISQNQAAAISERRNQLDLQINLLTEQEITKVLTLLSAIAAKLDVQEKEGDTSLQILEQATRPEKLAEQIDRAAQTQNVDGDGAGLRSPRSARRQAD